MSKIKSSSRREFIENALALSGGLALKSLLIGVPPSFLLNRAMASETAQYLIYCCSQSGEPLNANAPGSYLSGVRHPAAYNNPSMMNLGSQGHQAAAPWAALPATLRNRMNFIHMDTRTNSHNEAVNVLKVQGLLSSNSSSGEEMLPSKIAQANASQLGTLSSKPILIGSIGSKLTYNERPQPLLRPRSLKGLFSSQGSGMSSAEMKSFRDQAVDNLYQDLKTNGTSAQRRFLDDYAMSSSQASQISNSLLSALSDVNNDGAEAQMIAAAALIASNAAPAIITRLGFGGDNHSMSNGATREVEQTNESIAALTVLWSKLNEFGIQNKTTFCLKGVFGRTLDVRSNGNWRDHNGRHTVSMMFGPSVKPGVTGGLDLSEGLSKAKSHSFNSNNGSINNPDITREESLASTAKTMMKACGVAESEIENSIESGKIIRAIVS